MIKFEARSTKYETISKFKILNVLNIRISKFGFRIWRQYAVRANR